MKRYEIVGRYRYSPSEVALPQKVRNHCSIGSVQGAVATWSVIGMQYCEGFGLCWLDQVATAPCTDPIQGQFVL